MIKSVVPKYFAIWVMLTMGLVSADGSKRGPIKIFDGQPKVLVVHGYSTSFRWPDLLGKLIRERFGDSCPIVVRKATKGGTPIAGWMDVAVGTRKAPWIGILSPILQESGKTPVVVLAQQSLQRVFGDSYEGIRSGGDSIRIVQGSNVFERYCDLLLDEGADLIFVASHIYKHPMEPEIGNERLALARFLERGTPNVKAGPELWVPSKEVYPIYYAEDRLHPGPELESIIAQEWFRSLLVHDGLESVDTFREAEDVSRDVVPVQQRRRSLSNE
jgi:hypothetical protein